MIHFKTHPIKAALALSLIAASIAVPITAAFAMNRAENAESQPAVIQIPSVDPELERMLALCEEMDGRIDALEKNILHISERIGHPSIAPYTVNPSDTVRMFTITGFCNCPICCGIWSAEHPSRQETDYVQLTASGTVPTEGKTVGADWSVLPLGTTINIDGVGMRTVEDKGAEWISERYDGMYIDVYFLNHAAAVNFGKQHRSVTVIE